MMFMLAGVALAFFVERWPNIGNGNRYTWIVLLGAIGLILHATMDGIALLPTDHLEGVDAHGHDEHGHDDHDEHAHESEFSSLLDNHLALGVILHRIPVGMAIWWAVRPQLGSAVAIGALAIIAISTSAAYLLGEPVIALMEVRSVALFQAFVAGTLLHVIVLSSVGRHSREDSHGQTVIAERLGIVIGLFTLFMVPHAH